jgi:hypothetical protein
MPGQKHKPAGSPAGSGGQFDRTGRAPRAVAVPQTTADHLDYNPNFDDWDDDVVTEETQGGSGPLSYHESFEWGKSGTFVGITHAGDHVLTRNGRVLAAKIFGGTGSLGGEPAAFFVSEDAQQSKVDLRHLARFADANQYGVTPKVLPSTSIENKMKQRDDEGIIEGERRQAEAREMSRAQEAKNREMHRAAYAAQQGEAHAVQTGDSLPQVHENMRMEPNEVLGHKEDALDSLEDIEQRIRKGGPKAGSREVPFRFQSSRLSKKVWTITPNGTNETKACVFVSSEMSWDKNNIRINKYFVGEINQEQTGYASDESYSTQREALKAAERRAIQLNMIVNPTKH